MSNASTSEISFRVRNPDSGAMLPYSLPHAAAVCGTPEYQVWSAMRERCFNPPHPRYHRYGGRGITVCNRWSVSSYNFLSDMGPRPSPNHEIHRVDNDK